MKKTTKIVSIILFIVLIIFLTRISIKHFNKIDFSSNYFCKILNNKIVNNTRYDQYNYLIEEYKYLNELQTNDKFILFVGDSITKRFNITEFSTSKNILNRGIFSDTTDSLIKRIYININNINIYSLFIMIGYNDLEYHTNEEIVNNIHKILSLVKSEKIYIQSLLPVDHHRKTENERILYINKKLMNIADEEGYFYIDLHKHFTGNTGGIRQDLTTDGIHPNLLGYKLWYSLIEHLL